MVDYTQREERLRENLIGKMCMFSHRPSTTERRTIKKNFRGGYLNIIKQNYTDFEEERHSFVYVFTITSSSTIDHRERRKIFFFREK